jgi:translocation and assembly module TamB
LNASSANPSTDAGRFTLLANRVRLPLSPEQRVVLSGTTEVTVKAKSLVWTGKLTADEGLIELRSADASSNPTDVVIVRDRDGKTIPSSAAGKKPSASSSDATNGAGFQIAADLVLDLGQRIKVIGTGVDARLQGSLNLRGTLPDAPRVVGTVNVVNGTYVAYGQRLEIDRGRLVFNGPFDNPTLDIVALRKNQSVEVGVALSGTALNPRLRLVSIPDRPDSEKLSWLVLGVGIENNRDNAQSAALQAATATFLGEGGSLSNSVAKTLGLDVLSIRAAPTAGLTSVPLTTPGLASTITNPSITAVQQNVVTLGKRLSSRLYVSYEQGLRGVWNLLKIQYDISNRLSLRAQTGSESAVDLLLFYPFD